MHLARFPRVRLGHFPTPLERLDRLTAALDGPEIWIKRDDCTGLASGGNKTRKLEYLVADAMAQGADTLVTQGATQSNHVRQTAAAACRVGMECHALLERRVTNMGNAYDVEGNVLLDDMFKCVHDLAAPTSISIRRSAAKPIISRRISASGVYSTSARRLIMASVIGGPLGSG